MTGLVVNAKRISKIVTACTPLVPDLADLVGQYLKKSLFDEKWWKKHFGDVGAVPPLPENIDDILQSPCPIWEGKKISDTHILALIPKTINGHPLTLKKLIELFKHPIGGNASDKFFSPDLPSVQHYHEKTPAPDAHWVLMTKKPFPGSQEIPFAQKEALVQSFSERAGIHYEIPSLIDATTCTLLNYNEKGTWFYDTPTFQDIVCQESIPGILGGKFLQLGLHSINPGFCHTWTFSDFPGAVIL